MIEDEYWSLKQEVLEIKKDVHKIAEYSNEIVIEYQTMNNNIKKIKKGIAFLIMKKTRKKHKFLSFVS